MLNYRDFEIKFQTCADGSIQVEASGPAGSVPPRPFRLMPTGDHTLVEQVKSLRANAERHLCRKARFGKQKTTANVNATELGAQLFEAIFDDEMEALLEASMATVQQQREGLRIKLRIDPSDPILAGLHGLSWELMHRRKQGSFLALSNQFPVVRCLNISRPCPSISLRLPFRVLVVISQPNGTGSLDLARERDAIRESWGQRADVQVDFVERATKKEIQRVLGDAEYHVFHYMGHGDFDVETGKGVLLLEDEAGEADPISGENLGILLADEPTLRLAFLNACNTAQSSEHRDLDPFSGVATALLQKGLPLVLAMQFPFSDEAAIAFSTKFYELLPQYHPIDWIVGEARKKVRLLQERDNGFEWATPSLFMRSDDGTIFEPMFQSRRSATNEHAIARLNEKVRERWIKQKLDVDIPIKPPIELNKSLAPKALQRQTSASVPSQEVPAGKTMATMFDESERSLLILGEPGYGKSTSLLALAQYLLRLYDRDPAQPVPVVLYLSSWAKKRQPIADWAQREVLEFYRVSDRDFSEWLENGQVVLLLDGLDTLPIAAREQCVKAINDFADQQISRTGFSGIAVCSRFDEYQRCGHRLNLESAIQLQPLTESQILDFLQKFEGKMAGLRSFIKEDATLLEDAKTPLVLGMLSVAYHMAPEKFSGYSDPDGQAEVMPQPLDDRKEILVQTYLERVFEDHPNDDQAFSQKQILAGVRWLASRMAQQHQSVFQLENLQPSWLTSNAQKCLYAVVYGAILGFVVGSALEVIWLASFVADPPTPLVRSADYYIYPLAMIAGIVWSLLAVFFPDWITRDRHDGPPEERNWQLAVAQAAKTCALIYVVWVGVWFSAFLILYQFDFSKLSWLSHALNGGITIAVLYGIKTFRQNQSFTGTTELIRWDFAQAKAGVVIGLGVGVFVWLVYVLINFQSYTMAHLAENLALYPPLGAVVGALFAGWAREEAVTKTEPNEGVKLSLRNSLYAMVVFGITLAAAMIPMLLVGHRNPELTLLADFGVKLGLCSVLGIGAALSSFLWFGGVDVMRHYAIRLTLWLTGQFPLRAVAFLEQAARLSLMQRIGGGYMFRNNLLREHFLARTDTEDTRSDRSD